MNLGDRVVAVRNIIEIGFTDPDEEFVHAAAGDVGEVVGFGDEAPTFIVDWGRTLAEVFREEIRPCVPFPVERQDELEP